MSPAPAASLLERRGRIRNMARAGEDPRSIALGLRVSTRSVLSVLAMPETDIERDAADLLAGWSPDCMDATDWTHWQHLNPGNVSGGKALKPCWDCPLEFAVEMRGEDRCNGSPGRPTGRPVRETSLIALPEFTPIPVPVDVRPIDVARAREREAFVHQVSIQAQIDEPTEEAVEARVADAVEAADVLYPDQSSEEEPAMSEAAPPIDVDEEPAQEPVALENALEQLASAASKAAGAWSDKVAAEQGWVAASEELEGAWSLVTRGHGLLALGDLVEAADRAIVAGVDEAAEEILGDLVGADAQEPTPHQVREREARPPAGLTPRQTKVLAGLKAGKSRSEIAGELGVVYQSVDGMIEAMAKKGLIPPELFPLLPARLAKYATVRA